MTPNQLRAIRNETRNMARRPFRELTFTHASAPNSETPWDILMIATDGNTYRGYYDDTYVTLPQQTTPEEREKIKTGSTIELLERANAHFFCLRRAWAVRFSPDTKS